MSASEPRSYTLRPHERLRRPTDFRRVYEKRRSVSDTHLIVYACPNGLPYSRLGLSVSRKVGGAVQRNRIKRLFREAFRRTKHAMPTGLDLVLIPRSGKPPPLQELLDNLPRLVNQLGRRLAREAGTT